MKAKPKFDKDKAKTFLLQHVEKIIFGFMVLVAAMLCWSAFGLTPYKGSPDDLKKKANDVSQRVQTSTPPEPLTDLPPKRDLNRMLRNALADVNPGLFPMSEISRPYADRKVRRQQPKLLAVVDLKAAASFGAIATSENGGKFAARRGGMDMMQGGGMPGGDYQPPEMTMPGMMPGMSGMPDNYQPPEMSATRPGAMPGMMPGMGGMPEGYGMPAGRGRAKKPAKAKKPVEKPKVKAAPEPVKYALEPPGGAKLEGKYWVSLVGLVPAWDQDAEFQKVFRDAIKTYPTDIPQYITCEVERAEIVSPGEVGEYEALDMDQAFEYMGKWAAEYPEVVDDKYLTPSYDVSEPLPPLVLANHDPSAVRHPKIPLKDEAAADAKKAAEEEAEGEDESDKKKPRRSSRLRGRTGAGMPGMPGQMPGTMSGGMPGMNPMAGMQGMGQATREKIEFKLFRFFDFQVTPGKTYKYRVRLVLANPNFEKAKRYLADPKLAEDEVLYTDWSEPSPDVFVPLGSELLAGEINPKEPNAKVMVRQFDKDTAITAVHIFDLARGATANENAVKVPTPAKSGMPDATTEEEIDFNTNATVVDVTGGEKLATGPKGKMPGRVLVMRSDGELALLSEFADAAKFDVEQDRLKEAKDKSGKNPNSVMMPDATADPASGGFGNFFQDQEPTKKKPRR